MDWNAFVWKIVIAIAPIIVSVVAKLILDMVEKMTEKNRERLEYWIEVFIKMAQMIEPDPVKRKEWVMSKISGVFPDVDKEQLSALIEAILASIKLENGDLWEHLPPETKTPVASV
jgi:hypothetical protein